MNQDLSDQESSRLPCDCYCCRWDRTRLERMGHGLQPSEPPGMPLYTAAQLLECMSFMKVGPVCHLDAQAAEFWGIFGDHLLTWLREEVLSGRIDEPEPAKYGASSLLMSIEMGGDPCTGVEREPYAWAPLGGEELLYDGVVHGLLSGWEVGIVVDGLCSFLRYLGRVGAIDGAHAQDVLADLAVWAPRFLEETRRP